VGTQIKFGEGFLVTGERQSQNISQKRLVLEEKKGGRRGLADSRRCKGGALRINYTLELESLDRGRGRESLYSLPYHLVWGTTDHDKRGWGGKIQERGVLKSTVHRKSLELEKGATLPKEKVL